MTITKSIKQDEKYIWHPFTQHKISPLPIKIVSGKMTKLKDEKGNSYIDLISSWWVNVHGHCHPYIARAIFSSRSKNIIANIYYSNCFGNIRSFN